MTTARDWINLSLRAVGALGQGESLQNDDATIALDRLNMMLDSWSLEPGTVHAITTETFSTSPNVAAYSSTLLSGGRPAGVNSVTIADGTLEYATDLTIDETTYREIPDKAAEGIPSLCWINMGFPNATFTFWPVPYAVWTVKVGLWRSLTGALTLSTTVTVPPGYAKAIVDALAVDVAPLFGKQPNGQLMAAAQEAKAWVKRANYKPREMLTGVPAETARQRYDIYGG